MDGDSAFHACPFSVYVLLAYWEKGSLSVCVCVLFLLADKTMCPFKKIFVLSSRTAFFPPRRRPSTLSRVGCRVAAPLLGLVLPVPASGGPSVAPWCSPQADLQAVLSVHVPGSRPLRSPNLLLDWSCLASMSRALLSRHADFTRGCDTAEEATSRHPRPPSNPPASVLGGVEDDKGQHL